MKDIFGPGSNTERRIITDVQQLQKIVEGLKTLGLKVVLTQGTYDLAHIGHARYFEAAKAHGDILIVGVDSDEKVRARKGPERPIVPEAERMEMLTHMRYIDFVYLKPHVAPRWHLTKAVQPDVLIATKETYTDEEIAELKNHCKEVLILEPQATTSTSAKIRRMQINTANKLEEILVPELMKTIQETLNKMKSES
jgi:D-glycero-beta-D-manno-heptose 1-phosphate adenylyltransferase